MTQAELARRSGVAVRTVRNLELGWTERPRRDTVRLLVAALGLAGQSKELFERVAAGQPPQSGSEPESPRLPPSLVANVALPLIGREEIVERLHALLSMSEVRLLTLTGPPGTGKTRLGLELAARRGDCYRHGIALVSLGPLTDPRLVLPAILRALGCAEAPNEEPIEAAVRCCRDRQMLLLLDNFEHLLAAGPALVELLTRCPGLSALVTSRARLRVRLERQLPVPPLDLAGPEQERAGDPEELRRVPAVRLFVERAEAAAPSFRLTAQNAAAVATICRRLDGLPLALELAAPWLQVLSPDELNHHLDRRMELLVDGPRDLPERQRTLPATLRWSYELLDQAPRALLRRLSVFAGGAALSAVGRVCEAAGGIAGGVLPALATLVEHSLAQRFDGPDGEARVILLESVRDYAREELAAAGELETTAQAHFDHQAERAAQAAQEMRGPREGLWVERLQREHDNMRVALAWAVAQRRTETGLRLAVSLWLLWGVGGHRREGLLWFERLFACGGSAASRVRAEALHVAGFLAAQTGSMARAVALQREALTLFREVGDQRGAATALRGTGQALARGGEYGEAIPFLEQAAAAFDDLGDLPLLALALTDLGIVVGHEGDSRRSTMLHEQALAIQRRLGNEQRAALCLLNLGDQARIEGDLGLARARLEEGAALALRGNWPYITGLAAANLAELSQTCGDGAEARIRFREALAVFARLGEADSAAHCLRGLAHQAWLERRATCAARLYGAADALSPTSADTDRQGAILHERICSAITGHLGPDRFAEAYGAGGRLSLDQAAAEAAADHTLVRIDDRR